MPQETWVEDLRAALQIFATVSVEPYLESNLGQMIFVGAGHPELDAILDRIDRGGRAVFLVVEESQRGSPAALEDGRVDDVLIYPFRGLEIASRIKHFRRILMWDEIKELNQSFSELIERFQEDLRFMERFHKSRLPIRFPKVKGLEVKSRYLAGLRAGGDFFDLAESRAKRGVSIVLSDSSSYGLSSAVLSIVMRVAARLDPGANVSISEMIKRIHQELMVSLSAGGKLSLFFGRIDLTELSLHYLNLGASRVFLGRKGEPFRNLPEQGNAIQEKGLLPKKDAVVELQPSDRLVLLSDGFVECLGSEEKVQGILEAKRKKAPEDSLNELAYLVKKDLKEDMPPAQDCSAIVIDLSGQRMRLA